MLVRSLRPQPAGPAGIAGRVLRSRLLGALTYPHGVDRYAELISPMLLARDVRAEVTAVRHQTPKSVTLTMRPNQNWRGFQAGQFIGVSAWMDGVRVTRPYSLAGSALCPGEIELTVSTHPMGRLSRHLRDAARTGMVLDITQAQGEFVLPLPRPERVLLISGGSGITPVMAMLRTLCDESYPGQIGFLNYSRSPLAALYDGELHRLAAANPRLTVRRGYTRSRPGAVSGRFTLEHAGAAAEEPERASTFVCGPPALVDAVRSHWAAAGFPDPAVEMFTPPPLPFERSAAHGVVRFTASDMQSANTGLPLLEQAEDAGLLPEHGCRMGICNTCSCRKRSGTVRNAISGALSGSGEEQIRICVSVPVGDVAVEL